MNIEIVLLGLLVVSTLTGLTTEAIKIVLTEKGKGYCANIIAGVVAVVIAALVSVGYIVVNSITVTASVVISIIGIVFLSWLCAMLGYDKVVQAISQLKVYTKGE